jgi:glutamine synthetase adenylyltransferase
VARSPSFEEVKLAQQMIKFITLHTSEGYLYKLDFRLRPMGSKGELLPSIDFYRDYFEEERPHLGKDRMDTGKVHSGGHSLKGRV